MRALRKTKSLKTILQLIDESNGAFSAIDIVNKLKQIMNKTTVYRILEKLEIDGTLHSFIDANGLKWYAKCMNKTYLPLPKYHPHFLCNKCGKVECVQFDAKLVGIPNCAIDFAIIFLQGKCNDCVYYESIEK